MLIFVDDSGDPGFKLGKGSSDVFVIAMVIFHDNLDAEETALQIKKLKRELGFSDFFEFKFNKTSRELRKNFLSTVRPYRFEVRAIVVEKEKIYSPHLRNSREAFYNFIVRNLVSHYQDSRFTDATIKIDGRASKLLRQDFDTYLRKMVNSPAQRRIKKISHVDSRSDMLIQLADMVAGTIRRSYSTKSDAQEYLNIIRDKVKVWPFK